MHGPWHTPEHRDEADNSEHERAGDEFDLMARLEAHADTTDRQPEPREGKND